MILAITAGPPGGTTITGSLLENPAWAGVPAIQNERVAEISVEIYLQAPGPRVKEVLTVELIREVFGVEVEVQNLPITNRKAPSPMPWLGLAGKQHQTRPEKKRNRSCPGRTCPIQAAGPRPTRRGQPRRRSGTASARPAHSR